MVAYFDNSNGIFPGDDVRILGVPVGKIDKIEPQPERVKITFWFDDKYKVPADAKAVDPVPAAGYRSRPSSSRRSTRGGPTMHDGARHPAGPHRGAGRVGRRPGAAAEADRHCCSPPSPAASARWVHLINTAADNLRGQGASIRDTVIKLSQAVSALGDHSNDIFGTFKNLSILVIALHDSTDLLEQTQPQPGRGDRRCSPMTRTRSVRRSRTSTRWSATCRASPPTTATRSAPRRTSSRRSPRRWSTSLDDIKQTLHIAPTTSPNFNNIYQPANGALTGALAVNNFANPITFLCGAIQAASRLGGEQSAKLCVQYLAPIVKNRQYNFPPLGENLFVGPAARPNEVTYSEDWMRPDYVPPRPPPLRRTGCAAAAEAPAPAPADPSSALPAEAPAPATHGADRPGRRPARHDGAPRRRVMSRPPCAARRCTWLMIAVLAALSGCGWRGLNSLPLPGTAGPRPGLLRGQGADARCQQPSTKRAGAGRRRDGRHGHQDRTAGLACAADHAPQRRRRSARQRNRQARPDQHARLVARRAGATDRRRHRRASCTTGR